MKTLFKAMWLQLGALSQCPVSHRKEEHERAHHFTHSGYTFISLPNMWLLLLFHVAFCLSKAFTYRGRQDAHPSHPGCYSSSFVNVLCLLLCVAVVVVV